MNTAGSKRATGPKNLFCGTVSATRANSTVSRAIIACKCHRLSTSATLLAPTAGENRTWTRWNSPTKTRLELLYESVRAQRRLLSGFGGNPKVPREKWLDAQNPKHVAISLNGEPTLYTRLSEYMDLCHKHGMTTMLVTNGTLPKVIEKLDTLPTQLYVSVDAPNKKVFDEVCKPKWNDKRLGQVLRNPRPFAFT